MLKVAISVIDDIADTNGTTVRARSVAKILRGEYKIFIVTRASSPPDVELLTSLGIGDNQVKIVRPEKTKAWNLKLIPLVLRNRFDCVYCVGDLFGFITYCLLSKITGHKLVFEAQSLGHKETEQLSKVRAFIYLLLETFIGETADAIIALSDDAYRFYAKLNRHVSLIPAFVDCSSFQGDRRCRNVRGKVVGLIGPFDSVFNKDQMRFLYANLEKFDKRIRFKVIGRCDGVLTGNKIEYTGYLKSHEEYVAALCQLDALLVPTRVATFGPKTKILEAMACGTPVFATPPSVVGLDYVTPGKDILVFSENELVSMVNKLVFDEQHMSRVARDARNTVERCYDEAIHGSEIVSVIRGLTNHCVR
jgi:glycosyltransferase involved in cell wall biosynthesis